MVELEEGQPEYSAEFEALNMLVESYFAAIGAEASLAMLRQLASDLDRAQTNVVVLNDGAHGTRAKRLARAWLSRHMTIWLARHG